MPIYTKTGDAGETGLLGGVRVSKQCQEIEAIGEVDELNGSLGILGALLKKESPERDRVRAIQHTLFRIGSAIASVQATLASVPSLDKGDEEALERWIDEMTAELPPLTQFILPGGTPAAAQSFFARAVCRRAERAVVELKKKESALNPLILSYLNRLSDALFVFGRWLNYTAAEDEIVWKK